MTSRVSWFVYGDRLMFGRSRVLSDKVCLNTRSGEKPIWGLRGWYAEEEEEEAEADKQLSGVKRLLHDRRRQ